MLTSLLTVPRSAPTLHVTVLNSTAVNVSWQVLNPLKKNSIYYWHFKMPTMKHKQHAKS